MKQKLCLGDCYALAKHKPKQYRIRYISLLAVLTSMCLYARAQRPESSGPVLSGIVTDTAGAPLTGATIAIKGSSRNTRTDFQGKFTIHVLNPSGTLIVSYLGHQTISEKFSEENISSYHFALVPNENMLEEVEVSTGYQKVSSERMTGSYVTIDNELLNRRVSTNILDRIDAITPGLIFNKSAGNYSGREPMISIRGRSTINANAEPLIVLDNFPYDGDLADINPNDVENITVLKDAAAASIWGARSGNGVIVITTKQGQKRQAPKVSVTSNITAGKKPDLYYAPQLTSSQYIEVEKFLFEQGAFNNAIASPYQAVSPAVDIFNQLDKGLISEAESNAKLDVLRNRDIRRDLDKYFHQPALNQQYNLNVRGGGEQQQYYLSAGYDKNRSSTVGNQSERFTFNTRNTFTLFSRLELSGQVLFTQTKSEAGQGYLPTYPYEALADADGEALPVTTDLKPQFIDTAGNGRLLDWRYFPLAEQNLRNTKDDRTDYRINLSAQYMWPIGLSASVQYQYGRGLSNKVENSQAASYYVRDQVNRFTQFDEERGQIERPVPEGDIRRINDDGYRSHYGRAQLNYTKSWAGRHELNALAAFEVKDLNSEGSNQYYYGYDPSTASFATVDYLTSYRQFPTGRSGRITQFNGASFGTDRFRSYLGNISYTFDKRYTAFGSIRRDESNLFGVKTNQKGVPLWSIGGSWDIAKEAFYNVPWLPKLKLRATLGEQGNIDRSVSAYLTAQTFSYTNTYGERYAEIANPPNPSLTWERVKNWNIALDFGTAGNRFSGSVDAFKKQATDLIANSPIAPQTGRASFRGNVADMETNGVDVVFKASWLTSTSIEWQSDIFYSYVYDRITDYKVPQTNNLSYMHSNYLNPFEGKPYSALFSFPYVGLDGEGNPQGYLGGEVSTDYTGITGETGAEHMIFHGTQVPTHFGSLRNTFNFRNLSLSFNISYKLGYFFRKSSLDNGLLYSSFSPYYRIADFSKRWKQSGDELSTEVPKLIYPANSRRDDFYEYSEALVEKADHIRLQDVQLSYRLTGRHLSWFPTESIRFYCYANNLTILWRATKTNLDPDVSQSAYPLPRTLAFGFTLDF